MTRTLLLAALLVAPAAVRADVIIRVPFVHVEVGPAVVVRAPFVTVVVPRTPPGPRVVPAPPTMPPVLPPARPVPPVDDGVPPVPDQDRIETRTPPPVAGTRAGLTLPPAGRAAREEEARGVTPEAFVKAAKAFEAGKYEVVFEHPHTGKPVKVEFELPVRPRRVRASRDSVEFRWGLLRGLNIDFLRDGGVRVN